MYFSVKKTAIAGALRRQDMSYKEIAAAHGCSTRTVARVAAEMAAGRYSRPMPEPETAPATKAEANKALSATLKEFENYYKEEN